MPRNRSEKKRRRRRFILFYVAPVGIIGLLFFCCITLQVKRYHAALSQRDKIANSIIGKWRRAQSSTILHLKPDGTGFFTSPSGTSHFDWTCRDGQFWFCEYQNPTINWKKIRRIAAMNTKMTYGCDILTLDSGEFEFRYLHNPSLVYRYTKVD